MLGIDTNTWALIGLAAMQSVNLYYTRQTEKNTNSMKDALVSSTAKENYSRGKDEERIKGEQKAATLAQGALAGKSGEK